MRPFLRFSTLAGSALLLTAGFAAQAQVRLGLRAGANVASLSQVVPPGDTWANILPLPGAQLGLMLDIRSGNVAFQPALLFSQKGYSFGNRNEPPTITTSGDTLISSQFLFKRKGRDYFQLNYLEMPLYAVYTFGGTFGMQLIGGPYVAVGQSGKSHTDGGTLDRQVTKTIAGQPVSVTTSRVQTLGARDVPVTYATLGNPNTVLGIRRFDVGFTAGVGFRSGPVQVQALYGWGVVNLLPGFYYYSAQPQVRLYNRVGQLTVTYLLGKD